MKLKGATARVLADVVYGPEDATVKLLFANGAELRADYWRVVNGSKAGISSFDHHQIYGLPTRIDAVQQLSEQLQDKPVSDATLDRETGDLLFRFGDDVKLQILNFTGYEVWEIKFPDGTGQYSNYAK